jgi:hypothetical protein
MSKMVLSRSTVKMLLGMVESKLSDLASPSQVISLKDRQERKELENCRSELLGLKFRPEPEDIA